MSATGLRLMMLLALGTCIPSASALVRPVQLLCHRTANEDVPENTLESLRFAALMGCNVVEVDVRSTLDGRLVLQHDGFLERLSDGAGEVEERYYADLQMLDAGSWMGDRFSGLRIPLLADALHFARHENITLYLDLKDKGMGRDVVRLLAEESMLQRVHFGGELDDVQQLLPNPNPKGEVWVRPGVAAGEVQAAHRKGLKVIANFSETEHAMDVSSMKAAVAAGVDGINVDYPRIGAEAVGRSVDLRIASLIAKAGSGDGADRGKAILDLVEYRSPDLNHLLLTWLLDSDDRVSRAAAVALVQAHPRPTVTELAPALLSPHVTARTNGAWALGLLHAPASTFVPLLHDPELLVQQEALMALARTDGDIATAELLPLLGSASYAIRGAVAQALARHDPQDAASAIASQLNSEIATMSTMRQEWIRRGSPPLTEEQKALIVRYYRSQMLEVRALGSIASAGATGTLETLAFRPERDFSVMDGAVAAFRLWDRIGDDPRPAIDALASADPIVADHAEWILLHAERSVLPEVRRVLRGDNEPARLRAIVILALRADTDALPELRQIQPTSADESRLAAWASERLVAFLPRP